MYCVYAFIKHTVHFLYTVTTLKIRFSLLPRVCCCYYLSDDFSTLSINSESFSSVDSEISFQVV